MAKYLAEADGFADLWAGKCTIVPLVTCGECKHFAKWHTDVSPDTGYYCTRPNQQSCNLVPDDFCSYGERREDG